ncbi:MAG: hypothetical protein J5671_04850 [Bacteroidaceae bacterium]|nr:hypothetical protein [Bacteroidaceae bacterium]
MKKLYIVMAALLSATTIVTAQDTFLNDKLIATDDVNGTSRYVGMGGAMGALGADISVISNNPAGIGLYRKSDVSLTFGVVAPNKSNGWKSSDARTYDERLARPSFDQIGFVWSMKMDADKVKYLNLAMNYQKKANYNLGFYADNANLGGLSQMDQITELANAGYDTDYNLAGLAVDNNYLSKDAQGYYNPYRGDRSQYTKHQRGSSQAFEFNLSTNISDRVYLGATFGVDNLSYKSWSEYRELNTDALGNYGDYSLYNDRAIDGTGVNGKLGIIVRPIADKPFRFGLTMETPTWYRVKASTLFDLTDDVNNVRTKQLESYLETTIRTPWRGRLSLGSTVDKFLAWGVEYEFANYAKTSMGYPSWDWKDPYHSAYANTTDHVMNSLTSQTLRGQHTVKVGIEGKPTNDLSIRAGYNFVSGRYKDNPTFDQYNLDSNAMNFQTSTDFMTLGAANIITFGLGYKYKKFYADMAYKYRMQNAKFYAFDTSFTAPGTAFAADNPTLTNAGIQPVDVPLNRHQVQLTLGFKF